MVRLIYGEMYRLLRKKSMYIYFCALAAAYVFLIFIRSGGFTAESVTNDAVTFFWLLPAFIGGYLFAAVYTDDLNSKNLIALVGFGVRKTEIVTAKFIIMTILSIVFFGIAPLFHCAVYAALGWPIIAGTLGTVYAAAVKFLLMTVVFSVLSGIAVYGLQRATFAIVLYILLAFGVAGSLLTMALRTFAPNLVKYLISGITDRIFSGMTGGGSLIGPITEYIIYVVTAAAVSILAFHKKEMEF